MGGYGTYLGFRIRLSKDAVSCLLSNYYYDDDFRYLLNNFEVVMLSALSNFMFIDTVILLTGTTAYI